MIDRARLFNSQFNAEADDSSWRAGMTLWLKSVDQSPAGSLPPDDSALARLCDFGRDLKAWRRVKRWALHNWVQCADGRLYHPVVCEFVLEGWIARLQQRLRSGIGNQTKHGVPFDRAAAESAIEEAMVYLWRLNPKARVLRKWRPPEGVLEGVAEGFLEGVLEGDLKGRPQGAPRVSQGKAEVVEGVEEAIQDGSRSSGLGAVPLRVMSGSAR
jgi:hypothetical protein